MNTEVLEKNKEMAERYGNFLSPSGHLVAVKLLKTLEGMEGIKRPSKRFTLCQLISQAHYFGRTRVAVAEDFNCYAVPRILGSGELPKEAWKRYVGWQFTTEEAAKRFLDSLPSFEMGEYNAVLVSAWERCPVDPDVVVFFGNAAQMLVIVNAYLCNKGGILSFNVSPGFTCANVIVLPIKEGRPKLTIPGNPWRFLASPSETELVCGIPGGSLEEILKGMEFMIPRGASRYPPTWPQVESEPLAPVADLIKFDGSPTWLKPTGK